jgi:hypothetical protein
MAYQYLQALPQIAAGASNKIWIVPVELTKALEGIGGALGGLTLGSGGPVAAPVEEDDTDESAPRGLPASPGTKPADVVAQDEREKA